MAYWYYSIKRHAIGKLENEEQARRWADAKISALIIFEATYEEINDE